METVFEAAGGRIGLERLAGAWHRRVMADEVVSHAFNRGFHSSHVERLAAYWGEALGGPSVYSHDFGNETAVVKMHSGNGAHIDMDRRAIFCFEKALEDIWPNDRADVKKVLLEYFAWATNTAMNQFHRSTDDVPQGLTITKWSWHGLVN